MSTAYNIKDIPDLKISLEKEEKLAKKCDLDNDHKLQYSNPYRRNCKRLKKLIKLIELTDKVEDYNSGLVLVNDKFVVSLLYNNWRNVYKNKWYKQKHDIEHFVNNYVYSQKMHDYFE